jgi:hypothetical protein
MARHRFTIEADADEQELRAHVDQHGDSKYPIVADPSEFAWIDLQSAIEIGLADEVEIVDYEEVPS